MSNVFDACSISDWGRAETLFEENPQAGIKFRDRQGWTILHEATNRNAPIPFVRKLLGYGMDPNQKNFVSRTPLHYAIQQKISPELLQLLIEVGANPNAGDKLGKTSVHWAVLENVPVPLMRCLILGGGDLNRPDFNGKTPVHSAVECKVSPALLKSMLAMGGDVNRQDNEGACSLFLAVVVTAPPSLIRVLLEAGGNMDPVRFRVARYHGNQLLCAQIEKARVLIHILSASYVRRLGRREKNYIRVLPVDVVRTLSTFLYQEFRDDLIVEEHEEQGNDY